MDAGKFNDMPQGRLTVRPAAGVSRMGPVRAWITGGPGRRGFSTCRHGSRFGFSLVAAVAALGMGSAGVAHAQSTTWDSMLSNSYWYVPQENLLAYMTSGTSFTDPTPTAGSDQTLWSLGTATNGTSFGPVGYASVIAVPEPSASCMALAGIACGGHSLWRRRKRA